MWTLTKTFRFEASHQLPYHNGKCANLHGHSYSFTLEVIGNNLHEEGPQKNMVVDYYLIGDAGKKVVSSLDHKHLNDILKTDGTTAEHISEWIFRRIQETLDGSSWRLQAVTVRETKDTSCRYSPYER